MNALMATLVAFRNFGKLNFISVTSSVPPITSTSEAESTKAVTEPPSTMAVAMTTTVPISPTKVAKSKCSSSRRPRPCSAEQ